MAPYWQQLWLATKTVPAKRRRVAAADGSFNYGDYILTLASSRCKMFGSAAAAALANWQIIGLPRTIDSALLIDDLACSALALHYIGLVL
jgi:hypothetical protein